MVRKTHAVEVDSSTSKNAHTSENKQHNAEQPDINIEKWLHDARKGAKQNSHMLVGIALLLLGLIQLRSLLLGMVLVTAGILFVS